MIASLISGPLAAQTELSAEADHIAAQTLEQRIGPNRRTVSRTADRIHVAFDDGREWLFVRNPVDRRRAMGYLVEHSQKRISTYAESDLRNAAGIRGWADVLSLGDATERWIVDGIREGVDESLLQLPMKRFPDYAEASYADWLEER